MTNQEIDRMVREHDYVLPFKIYAVVCASEQVDHIRRDGEWVDLWTNDGQHWRVKPII